MLFKAEHYYSYMGTKRKTHINYHCKYADACVAILSPVSATPTTDYTSFAVPQDCKNYQLNPDFNPKIYMIHHYQGIIAQREEEKLRLQAELDNHQQAIHLSQQMLTRLQA